MGPAIFVPAIMGGIGLLAANEQARKQRSQINSSLDLQREGLEQAKYAQEPIIQSLYKMLELAKGYNPAKETDIAVSRASEVTGDTLEKALRGLNARYRSGGGTPGNSSEFNVRTQGMTDRVTDPLREFIANAKANEFAKKLAAFQAVNGGNAGNLASNFFNAAQFSANMADKFQPNYGASLGLLGNAIQGWLNKSGEPGGAGGTGDLRQAVSNLGNDNYMLYNNGNNLGLGNDNYMNYNNGNNVGLNQFGNYMNVGR